MSCYMLISQKNKNLVVKSCSYNKFMPKALFFITETLDNDAHDLIRDCLRHYVMVSSNSASNYSIKAAQVALKQHQ